MESSAALGFGFRCGFLGLLHLEIIQERLTREYDLDLITTAPSVVYRIQLRKSKTEDAGEILLHNPADYPDPSRIEQIDEPWIKATIYTPDEYLGSIVKLCQDRRGVQTGLRESDLVKMGILVNNEPVDALSMIVHRSVAESREMTVTRP